MSTFVLVHGAWHGAWCWERLVPMLAARGHRSLAVDLPCDLPSATFDDYVDTVLATMQRAGVGPSEAILVGHSLGGHTVARVGLRQPVRALAHVCAVVPPAEGVPHEGEPSDTPPGAFDALRRNANRTNEWPDAPSAGAALYQDCDAQTVDAAFRRLRPQGFGVWADNPPLPRYPDVPTMSVVCRDDRVVSPDWSRWVARNWLHVEPVELPGDHSPMLSRPEELADLLDRFAR